jgi:hypothetical protein
MYSPPAIEAASSKVPAEFAPHAVTDEETDGAEPPAAEEDLDEKKADASLIVLEEDDEGDAFDIIGEGVKKDEET